MMRRWLYFIVKTVYLYFLSFRVSTPPGLWGDGSGGGTPPGLWGDGSGGGTPEVGQNVVLSVADEVAVAHVSRRFLSIALDSGMPARHWEGLRFTSRRLQALARGLSPAYLRLGGSTADWMVFDDENTNVNWTLLCTCFSQKAPPCGSTRETVQLSRKDWDSVNAFAEATDMEVLMDLNLLLRQRTTCQLNTTNLLSLLDYSTRMGFQKHLNFELGNEPNLYLSGFGFNINGTQNGYDVVRMRGILDERGFAEAKLVGPDVTGGINSVTDYIKKFISVSGDHINAVTYHHYSLHAETATVEQFVDPDVFDEFVSSAWRVRSAVYPYLSVWLGETNTAWGAGETGLTDTYINGLLWLDKLGVAAKSDVQVVIRQTFYGYNYSLVDHHNNPLPDYWLMLLHKRLAGQRVLSASTDLPTNVTKYVRAYAHCTADSGFYAKGSITYFVINLSKSSVNLWLGGQYSHADVDAYVMTPARHYLLSREVYLNGKLLSMRSETEFPALSPRRLTPMTPSVLPARTYAFYVIPDALSPACM